MANADEKTKLMGTQLKSMKGKIDKTKKLVLELAKSKDSMRKLQEDLDKHVGYLSSKAEENRALSG